MTIFRIAFFKQVGSGTWTKFGPKERPGTSPRRPRYQRNFSQKFANGTIRPSKKCVFQDCFVLQKLDLVPGLMLDSCWTPSTQSLGRGVVGVGLGWGGCCVQGRGGDWGGGCGGMEGGSLPPGHTSHDGFG